MSKPTQFVVEFGGEPLPDDLRVRLQERIEKVVSEEIVRFLQEDSEEAVPLMVGLNDMFEKIARPPIFGIKMPTWPPPK